MLFTKLFDSGKHSPRLLKLVLAFKNIHQGIFLFPDFLGLGCCYPGENNGLLGKGLCTSLALKSFVWRYFCFLISPGQICAWLASRTVFASSTATKPFEARTGEHMDHCSYKTEACNQRGSTIISISVTDGVQTCSKRAERKNGGRLRARLEISAMRSGAFRTSCLLQMVFLSYMVHLADLPHPGTNSIFHPHWNSKRHTGRDRGILSWLFELGLTGTFFNVSMRLGITKIMPLLSDFSISWSSNNASQWHLGRWQYYFCSNCRKPCAKPKYCSC